MTDPHQMPARFRDFVSGAWVMSKDGDSPQVGKIKGRAWYSLGDCCIDIVLYDNDGNKIGRASPPEGGPRTFEPMCPADNWMRIAAPNFPLRQEQWLVGSALHVGTRKQLERGC